MKLRCVLGGGQEDARNSYAPVCPASLLGAKFFLRKELRWYLLHSLAAAYEQQLRRRRDGTRGQEWVLV